MDNPDAAAASNHIVPDGLMARPQGMLRGFADAANRVDLEPWHHATGTCPTREPSKLTLEICGNYIGAIC